MNSRTILTTDSVELTAVANAVRALSVDKESRIAYPSEFISRLRQVPIYVDSSTTRY